MLFNYLKKKNKEKMLKEKASELEIRILLFERLGFNCEQLKLELQEIYLKINKGGM